MKKLTMYELNSGQLFKTKALALKKLETEYSNLLFKLADKMLKAQKLEPMLETIRENLSLFVELKLLDSEINDAERLDFYEED